MQVSFNLFGKSVNGKIKLNQKTILEKEFTEEILFRKKALPKKLGRSGQAELSETLLVLLVVVFLIVAGIFVYYLFFYRSLGGIGSEKTDFENLILLYTLGQSPELKCENEDCIDVVKLFAFKELVKENKGYYAERFGKRRITVESIYPKLNENMQKTECTLEKYQQSAFPNNCGFIIVYDNLQNNKGVLSVSLPVSLNYGNEYRIGILRVQI